MEDQIEKKRKYNNELYASLKKRGMCTKCHKVKAEKGHSLCLVCRMDMRGREIHLTEEEKRAKAAYMRELALRKKAAGICVNCDKPVYKDHVRCYEHYIYQRRKNTERRKKQKRGYMELGLCRICGAECVPDKKYCLEHYQKKVEAMRYANACRVLNENHPWRKDKLFTETGKKNDR